MKGTDKNTEYSRLFVLGIIYNTNSRNKEYIEALNIYDASKGKGYIASMSSLFEKMKNGQQINGVRVRVTAHYDGKREEYSINSYPCMDNVSYKAKNLAILNGNGEVIVPGKDVVIGTKVIDGKEKFVVINNSYEMRYLTKEEVVRENLVGVMRDTVIKASCVAIET